MVWSQFKHPIREVTKTQSPLHLFCFNRIRTVTKPPPAHFVPSRKHKDRTQNTMPFLYETKSCSPFTSLPLSLKAQDTKMSPKFGLFKRRKSSRSNTNEIRTPSYHGESSTRSTTPMPTRRPGMCPYLYLESPQMSYANIFHSESSQHLKSLFPLQQ